MIVTIRRARDAMDAVASGGLWHAGRNVHGGRRSRVVLAPRPGVKLCGKPHMATVARKAAHGESTKQSLKPLRGESGANWLNL